MRNMLGEASSPYLQQHKDNPVHWQVWSPETLALAAQLNRPVLLSIGYATCHWCHVMAHESFEDRETAELMNRHFINIKLDREERPDLDQIFMSALNAMGEQGGWPLTMVLTPQGEPFWGGTYFPPAPRFGRPSFRQVLTALANAWETDQVRVGDSVAALQSVLAAQSAPRPGDPPGPATLDATRNAYLSAMDWRRGGIGQAPKFPNTPIFRFLWQESFRSGDARAAHAVELLLERMSRGGIYDHLGGGYARYATDEAWLIPHFEKMLYDNALILDLLALAHARTPNPLYAARARETVAWLTRDMRAEGAFAAAEDADSEGEEGKFYVWIRAEIFDTLGEDAEYFAQHYPAPEQGNWEGKVILERRTPLGEEDRLAPLRAKLLARRGTRTRPGRDDKILADWNALTIAALARASAVFAEPAWLALAEEVFANILANLSEPEGGIAHAYRHGKISAPGLLEDQAAMLRAALALYQATAKPNYLATAQRLLSVTERKFGDGAGSFFMSADAAQTFAPRARNVQDGPTPSGIGLMAENYALLHALTGEAEYRHKAEALLAAFAGSTDRLTGSPVLLAAADLLENAACVVVTGGSAELAQAALTAPDPAVAVLQVSASADLPPGHSAQGKTSTQPAAFICRSGVCSLPVTTPEAVRAALRRGGEPAP
ncbi:MAG: thioredoxin domain-containing protein [Acidocella sp.]|uniref:thioredoxin domain-containing protein n=1 Tax=Acidocella sp. TaxID=50710 RepID=UPI003FC64408